MQSFVYVQTTALGITACQRTASANLIY